MKKLIIIRHAKSSWDYPDLDDYERPLNGRGKKNAPEMGVRLKKRNIIPTAIISSPAKRAYSTAKKIIKALNLPKENIQTDPRLYHGSVESILQVIHSVNYNENTIMIFGHNPGLTDLVNYLTGSNIYNIPTCGVAEIDFNIDTWKSVQKKTGELIDLDYPRKKYKG